MPKWKRYPECTPPKDGKLYDCLVRCEYVNIDHPVFRNYGWIWSDEHSLYGWFDGGSEVSCRWFKSGEIELDWIDVHDVYPEELEKGGDK